MTPEDHDTAGGDGSSGDHESTGRDEPGDSGDSGAVGGVAEPAVDVQAVENVVLLTVDALRADHVGHLGYDRETTPHLDRLADRGRRYTTCVAQSSHTRESMPSLFFSAYPFELGDVGTVPQDRPTLATTLAAEGFQTAGFHSNPYLSRAYGFDRGFDVFDDDLPMARSRLGAFGHRVINHFRSRPYARGADLTADGLDWLDATDGRRFLWLHYMDPHGPYQPPPHYQRVFSSEVVDARPAKRLWRRTVDDPDSITDDDRRRLVDLYDAEIRYVDAMIGSFVAGLWERELLSETLVVVAADHGDLFGEHGRFGHPRRLYEELIRVPLVVVGPPDIVAPGRVDRPVENVDLAPTLLGAAGGKPPAAFAGDPLPVGTPPGDPRESERPGTTADTNGPGDRRRVVYSEAHGEDDERGRDRFVAHDGRHKALLVREDQTEKRRETFDVGDDGADRVDVAADRPDVHDRLHAALDNHVGSVTGADDPDAQDDVDPVVADRLEELGYR